jgi:DNA polymerase-3 subunit alpha (Gram-positive type)
MKEAYVVLDIETTGLSKHVNKITEIAALRVENFQVVKRFETLVNPQTPIPSFITSLTGISDSMVRDAPIIEEVIPKFTKFVQDSPFVAHCATFDYGFIKHNAQLLSLDITNPKICTRKLSRRLVPELRNYKLSNLCEHFQIINNSAHRAMGDVEATHKIFSKLLDLMKKQGIERREDVLNFQDRKITQLLV